MEKNTEELASRGNGETVTSTFSKRKKTVRRNKDPTSL
jgi:hypothetical protein